MSEIKVNSIKGVGASAAAITVNNTDGSCAVNNTQRQGKNLIINGAMQVAQRGTASTANGYGSVDRFFVGNGGVDENPTHAQVDVASGTTPYTLGFRKALKITNGNQTSGAGAGDYMYMKHVFEAQDIANSGWNYLSSSSFITLSFYVKSSVAQSFKGYFITQDGTAYLYPFETGSLSADTWTKVTKTIPGNSNLTFNNDNGAGLELYVWSFLGTDFTASSVTEDAWATYSSSARTKDATSTWYTTNDATLEFTGFQLEVGSVATDFENRSFTQELALCHRYYLNYLNTDGSNVGSNVPFAVGTWYNSGFLFCHVRFPVPMRAAPTLISSNNTNDFYALIGTTVDYYDSNTMSGGVTNMHARIIPNIGTAAGGSSGSCVVLHTEDGSTASLAFNAEL